MHLLIFLSYMTQKMKSPTMNSQKVESWHGIIISATENVLKSWEGYDKNWMHFVYKTGNLFRSIRVSYGNLSVTKGFQFFEITRTRDFLCVQNAPFKAASPILKPFWLHLLFFMHLLIFLSYTTLKMKSPTMTSQKVESWHGIIISPTKNVLKSWECLGKNWMHFV